MTDIPDKPEYSWSADGKRVTLTNMPRLPPAEEVGTEQRVGRDMLLTLLDQIESRFRNEFYRLDCHEARERLTKTLDIVRNTFDEAMK